MEILRWRLALGRSVLGLVLFALGAASTPAGQDAPKRLVTVGDSIQMASVADASPDERFEKDEIAHYSPNGKRFFVVLKRGNTAENTVDYSLLLYDDDRVLDAPARPPRVVATFASSSNEPGIADARWLDDRRSTLLGQNPGETTQLYTVDCDVGKIKALTRHATNVISYAISADQGRFFFTAEEPTEALLDQNTMRNGIIVEHQWLSDLISLNNSNWVRFLRRLFSSNRDSFDEMQIATTGVLGSWPMWLSPDGRYLILETYIISRPPKEWDEYDERYLHHEARSKHADGSPYRILKFEV